MTEKVNDAEDTSLLNGDSTEAEIEQFALSNIDIDIGQGSLVAIVGTVGSGPVQSAQRAPWRDGEAVWECEHLREPGLCVSAGLDTECKTQRQYFVWKQTGREQIQQSD